MLVLTAKLQSTEAICTQKEKKYNVEISKEGNTIGNIRNYGYAVESDNWIYYLSPNEDSTEIGIFKVKNNGKNKQQLYMSNLDIVSLNVYKDYIYFVGNDVGTYLEGDDIDNKIYRMKKDGTAIEVLNDNELNNECYEIYVINNKVYYIGLNAEICKMDLNGANKTVVADNGTGYLGITEKYIIYNSDSGKEDEEFVNKVKALNYDGPWYVSEKIHGANCQIAVTKDGVEIGGRNEVTDNELWHKVVSQYSSKAIALFKIGVASAGLSLCFKSLFSA